MVCDMDGPVASSPPGDPLLARTILVIEDEPLIAVELSNELEAVGAHVICARPP
jgi:hypothetical protein